MDRHGYSVRNIVQICSNTTSHGSLCRHEGRSGCVVTIPVLDDCIDFPSSKRESRSSWSGKSVDLCFVYASKLIETGVYAEVHEWGGSPHTALYPAVGTDVNGRMLMVQNANIMDCFKYDLRRKWLHK